MPSEAPARNASGAVVEKRSPQPEKVVLPTDLTYLRAKGMQPVQCSLWLLRIRKRDALRCAPRRGTTPAPAVSESTSPCSRRNDFDLQKVHQYRLQRIR